MKKIFILILLTLLLSGCGVFNLDGWIMPDDLEFLEVVENLTTPEEICAYMKENFTYEYHAFYAPDPYTLWKLKEGDCNDFACFATFIANYHGYETYQIDIFFKNMSIRHYLGVFVENGRYTYSDNRVYKPIFVDTFGEVVSHYFETTEYELQRYKVYDYENDLVEESN